MDLMPILATLKRHKTAAGLIVLQVALTCAIVCNALFLISQRTGRIAEPSGLADQELLVLQTGGVTPSQNAHAQTRIDLAALRSLPGVAGVTVTNQVPFGNQFTSSGVRSSEDENASTVNVASYNGSEDALRVLGLRLLEGRDFAATDYVTPGSAEGADDLVLNGVIINQALAQRLFPGQSALGRKVWGFGNADGVAVIGVVEKLVTPHPGVQSGFGSDGFAALLPVRESFRGGRYVLRVDPTRREALLKEATTALDRAGPGRIMGDAKTLSEMRDRFYAEDRRMIGLLVGVCVALLVVTAFGIVGLASFWVQQRTRMIGTRRALGATRGQILRYFQTENFVLSSAGIVLGMLGAAALSSVLVHQYELPGLPWHYLPAGAVALWALGQLAVLGPARRAAALPPVAALRS